MPQWQHVQHLLQDVCECVYISRNPTQRFIDSPSVVMDQYAELGPMGGLISALGTNSEVAWLTIAVDMPFLTKETIRHLAGNRNPQSRATAYRLAENQIEPLVTVYEPSSFSAIRVLFEKKELSLQKFLAASDVAFLSPPQPSELISVDTPEAYRYWKKP